MFLKDRKKITGVITGGVLLFSLWALASVASSQQAYAAQGDLTSLGPTPYVSKDDSPFKSLASKGAYFYIEDFEDGVADTPGLLIDKGAVLSTGSGIDSVDADDGLVDGSGSKGKSWLSTYDKDIVISFNKDTLGGLYPNHAGLVFTDTYPTTVSVTLEAYGIDGTVIGKMGPMTLGDSTTFAGQTLEDKFIGFKSKVEIKAIALKAERANYEIDHVQYGTDKAASNSNALAMIGPMPYTSKNDSPFKSLESTGTYFYIEDFEDGVADTPGLTIDKGAVLSTGPNVDSVDQDDGLLDGSGSKGKSWLSTYDKDLVFSFNKDLLSGKYPNHAGLVFTDTYPTTLLLTLEAYGVDGKVVGKMGPMTLGDSTTYAGQTLDDKFIGFKSKVEIKAIAIKAERGNYELDHVQYGYGKVVASSSPTSVSGASPDIKVSATGSSKNNQTRVTLSNPAGSGQSLHEFSVDLPTSFVVKKANAPKGWASEVDGNTVTFATANRPLEEGKKMTFRITSASKIVEFDWSVYDEDGNDVAEGMTKVKVRK